MAIASRSEILESNPIGKGLDGFRDIYTSNVKGIANQEENSEGLKKILLDLVHALQGLPTCRSLPSKRGNKDLGSDLLWLYPAVYSDNFDTARIRPLLDAVLNNEADEIIWDKVYDVVTESAPPPCATPSFQQTPWLRNTSSFANSSEHRKYVDDVLKEELGPMYIGIPGFFEAFFGETAGLEPAAQAVFERCKEGDNPLYREQRGWQGWPEEAIERDVLEWLANLTGRFLDFAEEHQPAPRARRRPLAQPYKPLHGSAADRKLDIGFVDTPSADVGSKCHWKEILVPGELKSNPSADRASKTWLDLGRYAREVLAAQDSRRFVLGFTLCGSHMRLWEFDRLGGIASTQFDVNEDGLHFVSVVLGFLWLNEEQLGFDPSIVTVNGSRYIEIGRNNRRERLIIDEVMKRAPCIAGRATTCWKARREGDDSRAPLVIKDSWQFPEREEEGELLREATAKGVVNVTRYYHHETVRVNGQDDDIRRNVRRGLDITKATNYKQERSMPPLSTAGRRISRKGRSSSAAWRKRSSSGTDAPLPPSKRPCSSSPTKVERAIANRVHRRVIVRDFGKAIYKASSLTSFLAALEGCITGYESLHTQTGMLQSDVSPNNLMVNEEADNPSWHAFLIDFDLVIREQREKSSGALGKTGTRAFMAIGILLDDEPHSFMHDLQSFFWVLFWICVHYDGPGKDIGPTEFEDWNYKGDRQLADSKKGVISDERDFLKTAQMYFTPYFKLLAPYVNRLRRKVFPNGERWRDPNRELYAEMKDILQAAQHELKEVGGTAE